MADEHDEAWIRLLWELSGKGRKRDGTHRDPTSAERKHIVRQLRNVGTRKTRREPAPAPDDMRFIDTLFHAAERTRADLSLHQRLKKKQDEAVARGQSPDLYRYLPKPWKGKTGRAKRTSSARELAQRAQQLHRDESNLTHLQIAERLGLTGKAASLQQRIRRYLIK